MNELVSNIYFLYQYNYLVLIRNCVNHILHKNYINDLVSIFSFSHYEKMISI